MSDIRDRAAAQRWWSWHNGLKAEMDDYIQEGDNDGEPIFVQIPIVMVVCPTCDGRGAYVNPNIDRHGLSREDFDEDPDFAESYRNREYDVLCDHCKGQNVIPWPIQEADIQRGEEWLGMVQEWEAESAAERRMGA